MSDRGVHHGFFRDLNVFKRNKKRFFGAELKVVALLLYTFGASVREDLKLLLGALGTPLEVERAGLGKEGGGFEAKPGWRPVIAVDESVVKCGGGRPIYVWVAADAVTRRPVWFGVPLTRTMENALRFLRRLRRRCIGDPAHG